MATKYIFVTGGVVSGLGKGITAASLGRLLKTRGLKVASQKLDPYINVDPGTMSPLQHGEVFVTDDGTETDLDLGHYERFTDENLNKYSNLTTGKVYWNVLNKERLGAYLGQTVQIIPHITNEIKSYIYNLAKSTEADVVITEIGGTTGDIESQPFLEAIRQVGIEQGPENCCYIHVVLVPYISGSDEYKSKPAQHSCKELQGMGIAPNVIVLRADGPVGSDIKRKISMFCNVRPDCVIENLTMPSLYECPLMLEAAGLTNVVARQLHLQTPPTDLTEWKELISRIATRSRNCKIALVGKPTHPEIPELKDTLPDIAPPEPNRKNIFLTGPSNLSHHESVLDFVRYAGLGYLVGTNTGGCTGPINYLPLPSGYEVAFTGTKVLSNLGRSRYFYRTGIRPDRYVEETADDIRLGRDVALEEALRIAGAPPSAGNP